MNPPPASLYQQNMWLCESKLLENGYWEGQEEDGRITLRWILGNYGVRMEWNRLRILSNGELWR
jgi:hypothetical protein